MVEEPANWTAKFIFYNTPLTVLELKNNIKNVNFVTENWQPIPTALKEIKLIGFDIFIPNATYQKARYEAEGKANIIFNYLSAVQRYPVRGHLTNMTSDRGEGIATVTMDAIIHKSQIIDLGEIDALIDGSDEKYLRQLAHYSRGLEAVDIVTKYREFYQVFEEDIGKITPPTSEWPKANDIDSMSLEDIADYQILRFIRNLVNHPYLERGEPRAIAYKLAAKPSLNLNNPEEQKLIEDYLKIIEKKARQIIEARK